MNKCDVDNFNYNIFNYLIDLFINRGSLVAYVDSYTASSGTIWMEDVSCNGGEDDISDCIHNGWGNIGAGCTHIKDVGVECIGVLDIVKITITF